MGRIQSYLHADMTNLQFNRRRNMHKKTILGAILLFLITLVETGIVNAGDYKVSVFNFGTMNIESSGLGTSVTNALISTLKTNPSISILDRKDLETFLSLNDLQQNDQLDNVVNIGSRLGLDFIVVGSVVKRGSAINVKCNLIQIDKKKEVYSARVSAFSESALSAEVGKLGSLLIAVLTKNSPEGAGGSASNAEGKTTINCPVNFQKIPGNRKITLRWQSIPGFAAAGYEVYRGLNQNGPFAMLGQTDKTEYQDQNVENNIEYYYKIRAYDKLSRSGDFTPVLSACTDFAPNPPIILKTEGRSKSILIVWVNSPSKSQDTSGLAGYKIYRASDEGGPYQEVNKLSLKDLTGNNDGKMYYRAQALPDGHTYFYCLAAFNEKGIESELCHPVKGTTFPGIASVNVVNDLIREVKLNWTGIPSPFVAAYNIYRSLKSDGGFVKIKKINVSESSNQYEYSDVEGLGDKIKYYYQVSAEDDLGIETSPSPVAVAFTRDIPPQPEQFIARSGRVKKVELTWQAAPQNEVEGYMIYGSLEKDGQYQLLKKISGRENSGYVDDSRGFEQLGDGKTYYYRLTAYNKVAAESKPAAAFAATKPRPKKPAGLKGTSAKVKEGPLEWQANPEKDISLYAIYRADGGSDNFSSIGQANAARYTDSNLKDGATYRYRIQAKDNDGLLSDFSDVISVTTKPKPEPPGNLKGSYEAGKATLSWSPNKESDISHYVVYEKTFLSTEKIAQVKSADYSDNSIAKGKSKKYVISAVDQNGLESEVSAEITVSAN
jgi:uncharacterized protein